MMRLVTVDNLSEADFIVDEAGELIKVNTRPPVLEDIEYSPSGPGVDVSGVCSNSCLKLSGAIESSNGRPLPVSQPIHIARIELSIRIAKIILPSEEALTSTVVGVDDGRTVGYTITLADDGNLYVEIDRGLQLHRISFDFVTPIKLEYASFGS